MTSKARTIADRVKARKQQKAQTGDAHEGADALPPPKPKLSLGVTLDAVQREEFKWLWKPYIPEGKLFCLDGEQGSGKSFLTVAIASILSVGGQFMDLSTPQAGSVIFMNAEDASGDTLRPRIEGCGGDIRLIRHISEIPDGRGSRRLMTFPRDADLLERQIVEDAARLCIIDPITNHLDEDINTNSESSVRRALNVLKDICSRTNCTIGYVRHLNKSEDKSPLNRGAGCAAFTGLPRIALMVGRDPDHETVKLLCYSKINGEEPPKSVRFQVEKRPDGLTFVRFLDYSEHTAKSMLAGKADDAEDKGKLVDAQNVLKAILANGPILQDDMKTHASEAGVSYGTLVRAKAALRGTSKKFLVGKTWRWAWILPGQETAELAKTGQESQP